MASNAGPVVAVFAFYAFIIIMLGLIGTSMNQTLCLEGKSNKNCLSENDYDYETSDANKGFFDKLWDKLGFVGDIVKVSAMFLGGIATGISLLGVWNFVLFGPLILLLVYIVVDTALP